MENVGLSKCDRQVTISVGGFVELQLQGRGIEFKCAVCAKDLAGNRACRRGQKIVVPIFNALDPREMFAGVLVGDNLCADRVQPLVSIV